MNEKNIRNFSIIAHIDHGKSTLADRLLEKCNAVSAREMEDQILDNMDLERERGITIKARAVTFDYTAADGQVYTLNLIDTPGHVDFNYEVSRSLAACEGALLVVDASQGIEAQTLANTYLAMEHDLEIRPVLNKIDLPAADPKRVKQEIEDILAIPAEDAPEISAKQGINIDAVLEDIVQNLPCPQGDPNAPLQALIFDSYYDAYRGVIVYMRLKQGTIKPGMEVKMMATGATFKVLECGLMRPLGLEPAKQLEAGQVGYFTASIKDVHETQIGDTVTGVEHPASEPLPGYRKVRSMVYCGIYTEDGSKYPNLRDALEKLQLNDASLSFEPESSAALGFGFRCGFLGMLHMEVIQERLEREFDLDLVTTLPSVIYEVYKTDGTMVRVDNPHNYPDPAHIERAEEPYVKVTIVTPPDYVGNIMPMCQDRRGEFKDMQYLDTYLVEMHYEMPLNEIIYDFFDTLKANTKGYASLDYELSGYRPSELVKVDIRWMRCRSSRTATRPTPARESCAKSSRTTFPASSLKFLFRRPSAGALSRARPSRPCARTFWPSATAAISAERRNCSKSRRRAKRKCARSAPCRCRRRRSSLSSSWMNKKTTIRKTVKECDQICFWIIMSVPWTAGKGASTARPITTRFAGTSGCSPST